jgi:hypothetical protein
LPAGLADVLPSNHLGYHLLVEAVKLATIVPQTRPC